MGCCRGFIKLLGFPLSYNYSVLRALAKAGTQSITIAVTDKFCFAVYNLDCSLGTSWNTQSATIAFFFIYENDIPYHFI